MKIRVVGNYSAGVFIQKLTLFGWVSVKFKYLNSDYHEYTELKDKKPSKILFHSVEEAVNCFTNYRTYKYHGYKIYPVLTNSNSVTYTVNFAFMEPNKYMNKSETLDEAKRKIDDMLNDLNYTHILWSGKIKADENPEKYTKLDYAMSRIRGIIEAEKFQYRKCPELAYRLRKLANEYDFN